METDDSPSGNIYTPSELNHEARLQLDQCKPVLTAGFDINVEYAFQPLCPCHYQTRHEAQQDILDYISMFYNSYRLHSYYNYRSPDQYEMEMTELRKVA